MPARTCSAMRAEVKRPRQSTADRNCALRGIGPDDPGLERRDELRDDEVPEEHLHQQRDVAEELDPRVAEPHEPRLLRRADRADERADDERDDPRGTPTRASVHPMPEISSRGSVSPPPGISWKKTPQSRLNFTLAPPRAGRASRCAAPQTERAGSAVRAVRPFATASMRRPAPVTRRPCRSGSRTLP